MPFKLATEVDRVGCYLLESAVLSTGEVDAQQIGLKQPSLASLGTVLLGAAAARIEPETVQPLIDVCERSVHELGRLSSVAPRSTDQTSWAVAQVFLGLIRYLPAVSEGTIITIRDQLLDFQKHTGAWSFRNSIGDEPNPIFSLYPTLALHAWMRLNPTDGIAEEALSRLQGWVHRELDVAQSPEDGLVLLFLCRELAGASVCNGLRAYRDAAELVEATFLARLSTGDFPRSWSVMQGGQPLWYVHLDRQFVYLLTRRIWPTLHPINIAAASAMLDGFDPIEGGWRSSIAQPGEPVYSWSTALGIVATRALHGDLIGSYIDAESFQTRVREVLDVITKYDVVISFSGNQRYIAERIVRPIKNAGYTIFYDFDRQHELLGEDLAIYLHKVYFSQSRYAIAVLSEDFVKSRWAGNWEWKAILARMQQSRSAYLLPYFYEPVDVPGLNPTIGHISAATHSPEQFADLVIKKLRGGEPSPARTT